MADKNAVFLTRHIGNTTYKVRVYLSEKMCIRDRGREVLDELILFWASYESCVNGFIATYQTAEVSE